MNLTMIDVRDQQPRPRQTAPPGRRQIRRAIAEAGEAKPGEAPPTPPRTAAILDVNTNTVLRALRQLRDEGLLEFVAEKTRGGGGNSKAPSPAASKTSSTYARTQEATKPTKLSGSSKISAERRLRRHALAMRGSVAPKK